MGHLRKPEVRELAKRHGLPRYQSHALLSVCAGLGWIGHSALLVTPGFGKSVRLTSVLTDAPFACAEPVDRSRCGTCHACVDACPAAAIKGDSEVTVVTDETLGEKDPLLARLLAAATAGASPAGPAHKRAPVRIVLDPRSLAMTPRTPPSAPADRH